MKFFRITDKMNRWGGSRTATSTKLRGTKGKSTTGAANGRVLLQAFKTSAYALAGLTLVIAGFSGVARGQCCPPVETCAPLVASAPCMVPQVVMEKQKRTVTRYRHETRERTVVVNREVPEKKTVEEEYTVMTPQQRTRTVEVMVGRPVAQNLELRATTMTPHTETRQATQTVCRMVPVEEVRTSCEVVDPCAGGGSSADRQPVTENTPRNLIRTVAFAPGADAERPAIETVATSARDPNEPPAPRASAANGAPGAVPCETCGTPACDSCTPRCRPEVVRRNVKVTCLRPVSQQETVEYPVTRFEPNVQSREISYNTLEPRKETREEEYTVEVPQKKTRTREVTVMRTVAVEEKEQYQVTLPYQEQIEVSVPRLRWVPQTITAPPATPNCGGCGG